MRLSFSSVALLSLYASGCDAFASPTGAIGTRSLSRPETSIFASSELSGLLNDYKSSIPTSPLEEVASSAVLTPSTEDSMQALSDAVNSASGAAERAATAASAVAAKSVAATKSLAVLSAAAPSASMAVPLKPAVGGFGIVAVNRAKLPQTGETFDAAANARERLAALKLNMGLPPADEGGTVTLVPSLKAMGWKSAATKATGAAATAGATTSSFDWKPIVESLHLEAYGGWYVAAAMVLVAAQQRRAGKNDATAEFESELFQARERADEAAAAAGVAAQGARLAKDLAMKMQKMGNKDGHDMLDASRLKRVEVEKEFMNKELHRLAAQVANLETKLYNANKTDQGDEAPVVEKRDAKIIAKSVVARDPEEDKRILEILKEMDKNNKKASRELSKAMEKKPEKEARAPVKQVKKKADAKTAQELIAKEVNAKLEADKVAKVELSEAMEKKQEEKARVPVKKVKKKADAKTVQELIAKEVNAKLEADKVAKVAEAAQAKAGEKEKTARPSKRVVKKPPVLRKKATSEAKTGAKKTAVKRVAAVKNEEWKLLSDSTLKRKTVVQLTEYLSERGVSAIDDSGKTRKKAELVEAVRSL